MSPSPSFRSSEGSSMYNSIDDRHESRPADVEDTELQITAISRYAVRDKQGQKRFDHLPRRSRTEELVR
eukprot:2862864-Heterocapsa_arctica.AAC.1